jgi:indolepyruvate ferredoxin oxidoreductase
VETLDAQALAEAFLGDSIVSNILSLGFAWQRGLVPVSLEALMRAIELNGVAVENNKLAFSLGRLAAGDAQAVAQLLAGEELDHAPQAESIDALIARGHAHLTGYQSAGYAREFDDFVREVMRREQAATSDANLPFTRAVAQSLMKLMAYKDEYEVARLYTDGEFLASLKHQFEGDVQLEFFMAPPVIAKSRNGQAPRKVRLGGWLMPAMRVLAQGKRLRGTVLDFFGRTQERRMERELIAQYRARMATISQELSPDKVKIACDIAALPLAMRGFGHVKLANVALARAREAELLHRFDPQSYPRPPVSKEAGQIRGIRVSASAH